MSLGWLTFALRGDNSTSMWLLAEVAKARREKDFCCSNNCLQGHTVPLPSVVSATTENAHSPELLIH